MNEDINSLWLLKFLCCGRGLNEAATHAGPSNGEVGDGQGV